MIEGFIFDRCYTGWDIDVRQFIAGLEGVFANACQLTILSEVDTRQGIATFEGIVADCCELTAFSKGYCFEACEIEGIVADACDIIGDDQFNTI